MSQGTPRLIRWRLFGAGVLALVVIGVGVCEAIGWPFLAAPMQRWIGNALDRPVAFAEDPAQPKVTIHLLGGIQVTAAYIMIGAPRWSKAPHMLLARDARMTLGYADLWRASRGEPLHIRELRAAQLDGQVERLADGRASWQFGKNSDAPDTADERAMRVPVFGRLQVDAGTMAYRDAVMAMDLDARFSLVDSAAQPTPSPGSVRGGLSVSGGWHVSQVADDGGVEDPRCPAGRGTGCGCGHAGDARGERGRREAVVQGHGHRCAEPERVEGPLQRAGSVAGRCRRSAARDAADDRAVPRRRPGREAGGRVECRDRADQHRGGLSGAFTYDPRPRLPMLSGRLTGSKLLLADLGPAVGAPVRKTDVAAAAPAAAGPRLRRRSAPMRSPAGCCRTGRSTCRRCA